MKTLDNLKEYLQGIPNLPSSYRIAVAGLIFTSDDKVLLAQRGPKARDKQGKFEGVGGGVLPSDRTLHAALRREIREELGKVKVKIEDLLTVKILPGEDGMHWVVVDYICKLVSGTPAIMEPNKCSSINYFSLQEIDKKSLSYFQQVAMKAYKKRFGNKPFYKKK